MSTMAARFLLLVLCIALFLVITGCAAASPTVPPTPTPTPLKPAVAAGTAAPVLVPSALGLPQPQPQQASTPPAPVASPSQKQTDPKMPAELFQSLQQGDVSQQVGVFDLVGIWNSLEETPYGPVYTQIILERTGTYSQLAAWRDLMAWEVGTYYVGDGFVHFMLNNWGPKIYKGADMSRPLSWTAWYTIVNANTMVWQDRILNSQWTLYRQ